MSIDFYLFIFENVNADICGHISLCLASGIWLWHLAYDIWYMRSHFYPISKIFTCIYMFTCSHIHMFTCTHVHISIILKMWTQINAVTFLKLYRLYRLYRPYSNCVIVFLLLCYCYCVIVIVLSLLFYCYCVIVIVLLENWNIWICDTCIQHSICVHISRLGFWVQHIDISTYLYDISLDISVSSEGQTLTLVSLEHLNIGTFGHLISAFNIVSAVKVSICAHISLASGIWHLASGIRHLASGIWFWTFEPGYICSIQHSICIHICICAHISICLGISTV